MVKTHAENLLRVAKIHQEGYESAYRHMAPDRLGRYAGWLAAHPNKVIGTFGSRLEGAMRWSREHPETFQTMISDFENAVNYINTLPAEEPLDEKLFPNLAAYRKHRKGVLPLLNDDEAHSARNILAAARNSGAKLRWGETYKPEDGDYYGFHLFVESDRGMAAASITDLYENYTRQLDLYPGEAGVDALLANAITEAAYLVNPESELFKTFKNPDDGWIKGYDGFSDEFQALLYGEPQAA